MCTHTLREQTTDNRDRMGEDAALTLLPHDISRHERNLMQHASDIIRPLTRRGPVPQRPNGKFCNVRSGPGSGLKRYDCCSDEISPTTVDFYDHRIKRRGSSRAE